MGHGLSLTHESQTRHLHHFLLFLNLTCFPNPVYQVQAGTTFVGQEEDVFLKQENSLWTPSGSDGKLSGKRSWPFEFILPKEVMVNHPGTNKTSAFRLPPHFSERASAAYIYYRIVVTIKRGFLKVNQE